MGITKEKYLEQNNEMAHQIYETLNELPEMTIGDLDLTRTLLLIIDINNGFAKEGALYSPRIESLVQPIKQLAQIFRDKNAKIIAFTDYHTEDSTELESYPPHCMADTNEWELVDELKDMDIQVIRKNSTNGFIEPDFKIDDSIENVIIVGDCTDICIYQAAISIKADFNRVNKPYQVIVPMNLVDTFDAPGHRADFLNFMFLYSLINNGIKVVKEII